MQILRKIGQNLKQRYLAYEKIRTVQSCSNANFCVSLSAQIDVSSLRKELLRYTLFTEWGSKKFPHLTDAPGEKFCGKLNDFKTT